MITDEVKAPKYPMLDDIGFLNGEQRPDKHLQTMRSGRSPIIVIAVTTLAISTISIYCLASGYFIIFQNLFYIPIIVACVYYTRRGFAFSVVIACLYFLLTIAFTRESLILLQALVRVLIFVLVAGVITCLSLARKRVEESLRRQHDNLEGLVKERTAQLEEGSAERKQAVEDLQECEKQVRRKLDAILSPEGNIGALELSDIIDSEKVQKLMDELYKVTNIGIGIIDTHGKVLVGTGWQEICTKFHRVNPETCRLCMESDLELSRDVPVGTFKQYRCKNNMWDIASPIKLGDRHLGNIFLGQFLFDDETVDYETFRRQARRYGFNEQEYMAALEKVPRWSRRTVDAVISFYSAFAEMIGTLGYVNVKLAGALEDRSRSKEALCAEKANLDAVFESSPVPMFIIDHTTNIVMTNLAFTVMCGGSKSDILQHRPGNALRCVHSHSDPRGCGYAEACKYCNVRNGVEGLIANGGSLHGAELELELMRNGEPGKYWMNIGVEPFKMNGHGHWCIAMTDITERKKIEETLRENELKYRALFETSTDANLLFADGRWVDCNSSAARVFGCTREQIIGSHPGRFSPPTQPDGRSSEDEAVKLIGLAYTTGPQFFEWEHCRADGTPFAAEVSLNRLDLEGKPYMQAIVRDVSERKRAEESIALNSQRIQTLLQLNQMHDATLQEITDFVLEESVRLTQSTIGYLAFLNEDESVLTMHSWSKSAMAECAIQDKPIIYPVASTGLWGEAVRQRRPVFTNDYAAANPLKKGYPQGHVAVKRHMNVPVFEGSRIVIVAGVGNKNGEYDESDASQLTLLMESMWRMLERKRTQDKLKSSEEQYREAQAMGHTGHWHFDPVSQEFFGSPEALRIYGFPGITTVAFEDIANCVSKAEVERVVQALFSCIQGGKEFNEEFEICPRNSGETRVLHSVAQMQKDEHGNPRLISGILQDITERKQAEEEIRKLNAELEQRVAERTAQLGVANKELEAFAYSVSHDLRAPLRHIDGFVDMLQKRTKTSLDDQSRHYMDTISDSAKTMGTLIDDLLSFSRMGRAEMSQSQVDLNILVQNIIQEFKPETDGRDIQWKISPLPMVTGDRAMLRVVLVNLISNALKFTRSRKAAEIEIGSEMKNEAETVFFVRDNGVGFDMNYADKLFQVFQRLHRAEEFEGTGIGLANVYRVISRHGGRTWAEGRLNSGATFYFSLLQTQGEMS